MNYRVSLFNILAALMLVLSVLLGFILEADIIGFLSVGFFMFLTFTIFIFDGILQAIFKNREIVFLIEFTLLLIIIGIVLVFNAN